MLFSSILISRILIVIRTGEHVARAVGRGIAKHETRDRHRHHAGVWGRVMGRAQEKERENKEQTTDLL